LKKVSKSKSLMSKSPFLKRLTQATTMCLQA